MYFDADKNDHGLPYNPIKALTVPRPIGWISTISKDGVGNLAPFSYFNGLSYNPPFVMFSGGSRDDGTKKDSVLNAEETGEFVFNIATYANKDKMNDSSWIEDPAVDELTEVGLTPVPSIQVKPPRVKESPAHFECVYHQTVVLPSHKPESVHHVVFGRVVGVHVDDDYINEDGLVDTLKMKVIARLGYKDYTTVESTFSMNKRTEEDNYLPTKNTQAAE
ncbi:MAG: flavin reductase family protein [Alphaproteobacteria bacterium]|nr:flavin reductase family protein [Alphaproteobacteria bacterium]